MSLKHVNSVPRLTKALRAPSARVRSWVALLAFTILPVTLTTARSASAAGALSKEPSSAKPRFQTVVFSGKADPKFRYEVRTLGAEKQLISSFPVYAGKGEVQSGDTLRIDGAVAVQTAVWIKDELLALSEPRAFEPGASLDVELPEGLGYLTLVPVTVSVGEEQVSDELRRYDFNVLDGKGRQLPIDPARVSWSSPFGDITPVIPKPPLGCKGAPSCTFLPLRPKERLTTTLTPCLERLCASTTPPPQAPQGWSRIAAGPDFSCGLTKTGHVLCWGEGIANQLGQPTSHCVLPPGAPSTAQCAWVPKEIVQPPGSLNTFQALDVGESHACAVDTAGGLWCWGQLTFTQGSLCPNGVSSCSLSPFRLNPNDPSQPNTPARFKDVSVGGGHACAITQAGSLICFGANNSGEAGPDTPATFKAVGTLNGYTSVSAGADHSCALTSRGRVECWGWTLQLTRLHASLPGEILFLGSPQDVMSEHPNVSTARAVSAGRERTCVHGIDGTLSCLDEVDTGPFRLHVERIDPMTTDLETSINDDETKCEVEIGKLYCDLNQFAVAHTLMPFSSDVVDSSVESVHGCAVEASGAGWCWGENRRGQLGDGTTTNANPLQPVAVLAP